MQEWRSRLCARFFCFWMVVVLAVLVCACQVGSRSPGVENQALYIAADRDHLAWLSWQKTNETTLHGEWMSRAMPDLHLLVQPKPIHTTWSGQVNGSTISATIAGSLLQGTVVRQRLEMQGAIPGDVQSAVWHRVSQAQANAYIAVFEAYAKARLSYGYLQHTVEVLPVDSSIYTFAVSVGSAEQYVSDLRSKQAQVDGLSRICGTGLLAQFRAEFPPDVTMFTLSSYEQPGKSVQENAVHTMEQTTLWKQAQTYKVDWARAAATPLPQIDGMALAWKTSPDNGAQEKAEAQLSQLRRMLETDLASMKNLQEEATRIGATIERKARAQGCSI